jgi:hypothetical protein
MFIVYESISVVVCGGFVVGVDLVYACVVCWFESVLGALCVYYVLCCSWCVVCGVCCVVCVVVDVVLCVLFVCRLCVLLLIVIVFVLNTQNTTKQHSC